MPKRLLALLVALIAALSLPAAAGAATIPAVVAALKKGNSYVEPSLRKKLPAAKVERAASRHAGFKYVFLATLPAGSKTVQRATIRILRRYAKPKTTIVVVWKRKLAVQSNIAAYTAKIADGTAQKAGVAIAAKGAPLRAANAVSDALAGTTKPATTAKPTVVPKGGGTSWWKYALAALLVLALIGALVLLRLRTREARKRRRSGSLSTARQFHLDRLEGLALRHAGLARAVADHPDDAELGAHHTEAGAKLTALRRTIPGLYSPRELRTSAGELDLAEWHLASAEARLASTEPPLRPVADQPALCFFSHELGLATHSIEVRKADGSVARVRVCTENHAALEAGEDPIVSRVHVGGRLIPWPAAPTWYGAAGWAAGDLPGLEYEGREIWGAEAPRREPSDPRAISGLTPDEPVADGMADELPEAEPTGAYTLPDEDEPEATNPWRHEDVGATAAQETLPEGTDAADLRDNLDDAPPTGGATAHPQIDGDAAPEEVGDGFDRPEQAPGVSAAAGASRTDQEFDELDDRGAPSFDWAAHMAGDQGDREGGTGSQERAAPDGGETTVQPAVPWTFGDPTEVSDPFSPSRAPAGDDDGRAAEEGSSGGSRVAPPTPRARERRDDSEPQPTVEPDGGGVARAEEAPAHDAPDGPSPESGEDAAEDAEDKARPAHGDDPWDERPQA